MFLILAGNLVMVRIHDHIVARMGIRSASDLILMAEYWKLTFFFFSGLRAVVAF